MANESKGYAPLQERIRKEGRVLPGNIIKVDGFFKKVEEKDELRLAFFTVYRHNRTYFMRRRNAWQK